MNFATVRMGHLGRDDAFQFRAVLHHRPTKPGITLQAVAHFTSVIIVAVGAWLTGSALANTLGFVPLPPRYWLFPAIMLVGYAILAQVVKTRFIRRFGE
jgi:hypothetical protein